MRTRVPRQGAEGEDGDAQAADGDSRLHTSRRGSRRRREGSRNRRAIAASTAEREASQEGADEEEPRERGPHAHWRLVLEHQAKNGPPIDAAVPEIPATAPATPMRGGSL